MPKLQAIIKNPITYAASIDILFILLIVTCGFVLSEIILPGIISTYISPFKLFSIVFITLTAIIFLAHRQDISFPLQKKSSTYITIIYTIIFIGCVSIAGFRLGLLFGIIMLILCSVTFIFTHKVFQKTFFE